MMNFSGHPAISLSRQQHFIDEKAPLAHGDVFFGLHEMEAL
jgi:hypothetical protein